MNNLTITAKLINDPEVVDILLDNLNEVAVEVGKNTFGLPLYDETIRTRLRFVVIHWILNNVEAMNDPQ